MIQAEKAAGGPGSAGPEQLKLFTSYSRSDLEVADALVTALEESNYAVFMDRRNLPYGEEWQKVLYEYIRDCDTVVFLISERSIGSKWVIWELQQVTELNKRLMPVMISACPKEDLPPAVAKIEVLPREAKFDFHRHFADLVNALESNRAWVMQATKLHSRTQDWIHAHKKPAMLLRGSGLKGAEQWRESKPEKEVIPGEVLDFLLSSRQRANRWLRNWVIGSLASAGVLLVLLGLVYRFSVKAGQEAEEAQRQANAATAQSAAVTSLASNNDAVRGLLLAHEALKRSGGSPSVTAIAAWRNAIFRFGPAPLLEAGRRGIEPYDVMDGYAPFREEIVKEVQLSENGRWLVVSVEEGGTHELWRLDLEAKNPASGMRTVDTGLIGWGTDEDIHDFAISKSGRRMAAVQDQYGPGVFLFELRDDGSYQSRIAKWPGERPRYRVDCRFSDDDQFLLCRKFLWRVAEGVDAVEGKVLPFEDDLPPGSFSSGSKTVRLGREEGGRFKVTTWELPDAKEAHHRWFPSAEAANIAFPDLPLGGRTGDAPEIYSADQRWVIGWGRSKYNGRFVTTSQALAVYLDDAGKSSRHWEIKTEPHAGAASAGETLNPDREGVDQGEVSDAAFSGDGRRLVTIGKTLAVWDRTSKEPFARPLVNLSTEGKRVAIDEAGRWVASVGKRLQIWDLSLEVPAAFPIDGTSLLEKDVSFKPEDVELRFAAGGKWLVLIYHETLEPFVEFWDLRFDNPADDGNLARRNLSQAEWRSFFGRASYTKTFPDQPVSSEAMAAADALARGAAGARPMKRG